MPTLPVQAFPYHLSRKEVFSAQGASNELQEYLPQIAAIQQTKHNNTNF